MSDIHYIKIMTRNIEIAQPLKDDTLQRNNADFPNGTGSPYYMQMLTFNVLAKHIEKKSWNVRFHVSKTSSLYVWNPLDVIKDF